MMNIRKKHEIDARIAEDLSMKLEDVRDVTTVFLGTILEHLAELDEVHLANFGRFRLIIEKPPKKPLKLVQGTFGRSPTTRKITVKILRKFRVQFSKSAAFKRLLQEKHGPNVQEKKP